MGIPVTVAQRYEYDERIRYLEFLRELGADIRFETDTWICDEERGILAGNPCCFYLFSRYAGLRELVKYYAILLC